MMRGMLARKSLWSFVVKSPSVAHVFTERGHYLLLP